MPRFSALISSLALGAFALVAQAEPLRMIDSARIRIADIADSVSAETGEVDLGPAPPPGSSRLFAREDLVRQLKSQGLDPNSVKLPAAVRVQSISRRFAPNELTALVRDRVVAALPPAVKLEQLSVSRGIVASPKLTVGDVRMPKISRHVGPATLTAMADLMHEDQIVTRLPVTVKLDVSEEATRPLLDRGARVELIITRGSAKISASAVALDSAELGEVTSFKVSTTQKVLRGRVLSSTQALVVTP